MITLNPRVLLGVLQRPPTTVVQPVLNQDVPICAADPDRIGFVVFADVPTLGTLRISPDAGVRYGVTPHSNQDYISITQEEFPILVQCAWFIRAVTPGPSQVFVIEISRT